VGRRRPVSKFVHTRQILENGLAGTLEVVKSSQVSFVLHGSQMLTFPTKISLPVVAVIIDAESFKPVIKGKQICVYWSHETTFIEGFGTDSIILRPGEQITKFETEDKSWVTSVTWSTRGALAFSSKSSAIYIVDNPLSAEVFPVLLKLQPNFCLSCMIFHDQALLGAEYDGNLIIVENKEGQWRVEDKPPVRESGNFSCIKSFNLGVSITGSKGLFRKLQL